MPCFPFGEVYVYLFCSAQLRITKRTETDSNLALNVDELAGTLTRRSAYSAAVLIVPLIAAEVKAALEGLSTVGGVSVTKSYLGLSEVLEDINFPVWTVTFDGECSFAEAEWTFCPANIGDLEVP